jgi:acetylornithine deacetylase/succinyl-diaminopimelate desuccinylase-like protein
VADNKGNLVARICAIDAYQRVRGRLPLQVHFIIEGEEEIASLNLESFVEAYPELIRADANIWESGSRNVHGCPVLALGLKGLCYVELRVRSMTRDLHSSLGASVPNAAWRLTWALATLKGPDGRIRIPGFYDRVVPPSERDLAILERLPDIDAERKTLYGIDQFTNGHTGMDLRIEEYLQPTGTICGLDSGYAGPGIKTVMPAAATAKVDFRLVLDQDPEVIFALLRSHLDLHGFEDVETVLLGAERPARTPIDSPIVEIVADSYRELTGQEPIVVPTALGSGPMYLLTQKFGIPSCSSGAGHAASHAHAPNENIFVEDYLREIKQIARVIDRFAAR